MLTDSYRLLKKMFEIWVRSEQTCKKSLYNFLPLRAAWYIRFSASPISESIILPCKQNIETLPHYFKPSASIRSPFSILLPLVLQENTNSEYIRWRLPQDKKLLPSFPPLGPYYTKGKYRGLSSVTKTDSINRIEKHTYPV